MLVLENISKAFASNSEPILRDLSLHLRNGDFTILIGGNGSGKSTLLKLIQGEHQPDKGRILLDELDLTSSPLHRRAAYISCVAQDVHSGTVKELTLFENLALSRLRGEKARFTRASLHREFCKQQISSLGPGLQRFLDIPLTSLSGGQKQMLALVMATARKPKLLLLDEHCSALDPKISQELMSHTEKLIREHSVTTLMVTHSLTDALRYGDRLIMLREGRIILDASANEKASLTVPDLLKLYHHYEDSSLL